MRKCSKSSLLLVIPLHTKIILQKHRIESLNLWNKWNIEVLS